MTRDEIIGNIERSWDTWTAALNGIPAELTAEPDVCGFFSIKDLIGHIASEGAGIAVSKEDMETIYSLKIITSDPNMPKDDGAHAHEVGKKLKLDKATAGRRLSRLLNKGFAINLEQKPGRPGKWRLTDHEIEAESLLPSAEEIEAWLADRNEKSAQPRNRTEKADADQ